MLHNLSNKHDLTISNISYKLPDNTNEPIVHLYKCSNVYIHDLDLDGNKENQSNEVSNTWGFYVRNSCISLRRCFNVFIINCNLSNARSGGIVPALCDNIYIINCTCNNNFFDGIAPYQSSNIVISGCKISGNLYSGVSIDGNSKNIRIHDSTISNNNDWGVWFGPEQTTYENTNEIVNNNKIINNKTGCIFPFQRKASYRK